MKKVWEVIKKIFVWLGAVFAAIFTVLFVKEMPKQVRHDSHRSYDDGCDDDMEEINAHAAKKREEAIARIERADARSICEGYGTVCDTIAEGKERFRKRVASRASATGGGDDD